MVIARDRRSGVSRSIPRWFHPTPGATLPEPDAHLAAAGTRSSKRGRRRYVRRGPSGPGVNGSRNVTVVEDLECRDRPEDFLLDDRCAEVLDFDPVGRQKAPEASDPSVTVRRGRLLGEACAFHGRLIAATPTGSATLLKY
jgi:hypothetical protein